jgi:hypothetical protein
MKPPQFTRIKIDIAMPPPPPEDKPEVKKEDCGLKRLQKKVEYAIECIELDEPNWEQALAFLRKAAQKLENGKKTRPEHLRILDLIRPVLSMLGTYGDQNG